MRKTTRILLALLLSALLTAPAHARRVDGLAIGGEISPVSSGLSLQLGIDALRLQLVAGVDAFVADGDGDSRVRAATTLRGLYTVFQAPWTHLLMGLDATVAFGTGSESVTLGLALRVEHFFDDFFAVSGTVHLPVTITETATEGDATGRTLFLTTVGFGAGFHFHF